MTEGKVWLVGAGPGDTGLITVKGEQVLKEAQVVVYDHLVNPDLLARYGDGKRFINVGKQAGRHLIPQQEIQEILVREARAGNKVVRLKGGDPFLFGRGGEEAMVLAKEGIPFEVVPGVTSALAVPAYNGIPVTHRDCASSVHIITAHKRQGREETLDYPALAEDLFWYQQPEHQAQVRLRWGQDFYRRTPSEPGEETKEDGTYER